MFRLKYLWSHLSKITMNFFEKLLLLLFLTPQILFAQKEHQLQGVIKDFETGEELIGVNIYVEGQKLRGTVSDFNGHYSINVLDSSEVVFKYLGYHEIRKTILRSQELNIDLKSEQIELNTVVVSASRKQEKLLDAPSSISVVNSKTISRKAGANALDHLKNVSGVHVNKSGIQGGNPSVRGFNGYYSNDLMTLVDNRIASLPSLKLNAYNMIPTNS